MSRILIGCKHFVNHALYTTKTEARSNNNVLYIIDSLLHVCMNFIIAYCSLRYISQFKYYLKKNSQRVPNNDKFILELLFRYKIA
jgi:hypothetical protein